MKAEVPGVDKKDLTISISENELIIKGEVKKQQEINADLYYKFGMLESIHMEMRNLHHTDTEVWIERGKR